ncbi:MAG: N-acetyltransferase [Pseudomonadales bacterium]|nr:N-acetyltransferase [Pseudomonadales bacterium]
MVIRPETSADWPAIRRVTEIAFRGRPYAGGDEQDVIERLRARDALTLSLVAEDAGEVVGQVTFSPVESGDGSQPWYALGPISVLPGRQGAGIGARLIEAGLSEIEAQGALGCILTGNPEYYVRFGFSLSPDNTPVAESPDHFMLKRFRGEPPRGRFSFHEAFYG